MKAAGGLGGDGRVRLPPGLLLLRSSTRAGGTRRRYLRWRTAGGAPCPLAPSTRLPRLKKKDPPPQRRHGSLYRLIRVTCFLSSPTRRRLWMVEKNPRASSAERAKRSDKHGQDKHPSHPSLYCGPEQGSLPAHVREKLGGNRMCKHAHISHFIMGSTLSCCHGERTPDVPLLLEHSRPGLAAVWVQRYVTKCQHVLYTCVGAKYFGRRVHHGRWVFYINREH